MRSYYATLSREVAIKDPELLLKNRSYPLPSIAEPNSHL